MDVPKHLLDPEAVEQLVTERQPRFVPLERYGPGADPTPPADSATGAPLCLSATVPLSFMACYPHSGLSHWQGLDQECARTQYVAVSFLGFEHPLESCDL